MRELIAGKYADEDAALETLQGLDEAGQERLKADPTVLGDLRPGVKPSSVKTRELAVGAQSYEFVTPEDRREASAYMHNHGAWNEQQKSQQVAHQVGAYGDSLDEKMNASLQQAPTLTHHLSI